MRIDTPDAPTKKASFQGSSLASSGCERYLFSVFTSLPRMPQKTFTRARPIAVPWRKDRIREYPSKSPQIQGLSQVMKRVCTSFSSHLFTGVTYAGAIQVGPWPDSEDVQCMHLLGFWGLHTADNPLDFDPFRCVGIDSIPSRLCAAKNRDRLC